MSETRPTPTMTCPDCGSRPGEWCMPDCNADEPALRGEAMSDGLAIAEHLLRKVADYWDGRPLAGHGQHIYADLLDVLNAITPAASRD